MSIDRQPAGPEDHALCHCLVARYEIANLGGLDPLLPAWHRADRAGSHRDRGAIFELRESHRSLEITGQKRSRVYRYEPYLDLFDEPTEPNGARRA